MSRRFWLPRPPHQKNGRYITSTSICNFIGLLLCYLCDNAILFANMGKVGRQLRRVDEKNLHLDARYYEQLYVGEELIPSLFRITTSTEKWM